MSFRNVNITYRDSFFLFSLSFVFLFMFLLKTPTNGDTYMYAYCISTFEGPVIHFGYFIIGFIFHTFLQKLGNTSLQTLGHMSVFFGSISVACMYLFTFELTKNRFQSFLAAFILLFSGTFWIFSEHGEVYVPQLAFVSLSILCIMKKRPLISSLFFLVAVSITPTSCLALPPLIYLIYLKQLEKKQIVSFIVPILLSFIFLLVWDISRIIGILDWAVYSPKIFFENFNYTSLVIRVVYSVIKVFGKAFNLFSLIALLGFAILFKHDKKLWFLMLTFSLPFSLYLLNLGLFSDDHLIISFIVISFLSSYGLSQLFTITNASIRAHYIITILFISVHLWISYLLFLGPELRDTQELEKVIKTLESEYKTSAIMISDYNFGMAFWYLTQEESDHFLSSGRPHKYLSEHCPNSKACLERLKSKFWINLTHLPNVVSQKIDFTQIVKNRTIYFADRSDCPSWFVQLLLPDRALEKRRYEIPKAKKIKNYIEKKFGGKTQLRKIIDSPLYPIYVVNIKSQKT